MVLASEPSMPAAKYVTRVIRSASSREEGVFAGEEPEPEGGG